MDIDFDTVAVSRSLRSIIAHNDRDLSKIRIWQAKAEAIWFAKIAALPQANRSPKHCHIDIETRDATLRRHARALGFRISETELLATLVAIDTLSFLAEEERMNQGDIETSVWDHGCTSRAYAATILENDVETELGQFILAVMEYHTAFGSDLSTFHDSPLARQVAGLLWDLDTLTEIERVLPLLDHGNDSDFEQERMRIWPKARLARRMKSGPLAWGLKEGRITPARLLHDFRKSPISPASCESFEAYMLALFGRIVLMGNAIIQEHAFKAMLVSRLTKHLLKLLRGKSEHHTVFYTFVAVEWQTGRALKEQP